MDPLTILILTLFVLATGGSATAMVKRRQKTLARLGLQQDLKTPRRLEDQRLSLFDLFWDLGASDVALELMDHQDLLPTRREEMHGSWSRLTTLVRESGSYEDYLDTCREALQELFTDHRRAENRRRLPGLTEAGRRTISLPAVSRPAGPTAQEIRDRQNLRMGREEPGIEMHAGGTQQEIHLDSIGNLSATDLLMSVVDGSLGNRLEQWWKQRRLRKRRQQLDEELVNLYEFYADVARRTPTFYEPLYDAHLRWNDESTRLRQEIRSRPWSNEPWAETADMLYEEALNLSEALSQRAYHSTYRAIEALHEHARRGDRAMAGYLVYLNRHAFFAGRHPAYVEHCRDVEFAISKLSDELLRLRDEGAL